MKQRFATILTGILVGSLIFLAVATRSSLQILPVLQTILHYGFIVYIVGLCFLIFIDNNSPQATISWLIVFYLDAYLGFAFYILIGRNVLKRRVARRRNALITKNTVIQLVCDREIKPDEDYTRLKNMLSTRARSCLSDNNLVEIYRNGADKFEALFRELEKARETINLEYFIIKDGFITDRLIEILIKKAAEGVRIRIIYDAVGSWKFAGSNRKKLKDAGIDLFAFSPVIFPFFSRKLNYRNHRKIAVIDGLVGFVGGINIGDEYVGLLKKFGFWRDTSMMIKGSAVLTLQKIFINDWYFVTGKVLPGAELLKEPQEVGHVPIQVAESGPDYNLEVMKHAYFSMVNSASKTLWITTPYLVPDESVREAIINAAISGIDVRILIPSIADHFFVYWASQDNIEDFLRAGVRIYRYEKGFVHAKVIISDCHASVGTANLDIRSMAINYEVNAFLYDEGSVEILKQHFLNDLRDSTEVLLEDHEKRTIWTRVLESAGRLVSPLQ